MIYHETGRGSRSRDFATDLRVGVPSRPSRYRLRVCRVDDGALAVRMERYDDVIAEALQRLIDAVVDHLDDEMLEPAGARGADVHTGP